MEGIKKQLRFQFLDAKKPFLMFWGIVILLNILSYAVNLKFNGTFVGVHYDNQHAVVWGNYFSIGIFLIIVGNIMYTEIFNTAMEFSSTRKDHYLGSIIFYMTISLAMIIVQIILLKLEGLFATIVEISVYQGNYFGLIKLFFTFLLICSVANMFGAIFYRYGYWLWILIPTIAVASMAIGFLRENIVFLFNTIVSASTPIFCLSLIILSAIFFLAGWLLIRKIDVKNRSW